MGDQPAIFAHRLRKEFQTRRGSIGTSSLLGYDSMRETYAIRQRVGYIAQQFALPPDLSVAENINFFARVNGVRGRQRRQRISELLDFAGLAPFARRLAGRLSGGMRKKLALACSLIHEPQVMLLDEPTLGVDPLRRRGLRLAGPERCWQNHDHPYAPGTASCNRRRGARPWL